MALRLFGSAVEKAMGRWRMLVVFLVGGAGASLRTLSTTGGQHREIVSRLQCWRARGWRIMMWRLRSPMYFALRRRLLFVLALMVAADFAIGGLEPQVDNLAHVGGFVAGAMLALGLWPRGSGESRSVARGW